MKNFIVAALLLISPICFAESTSVAAQPPIIVHIATPQAFDESGEWDKIINGLYEVADAPYAKQVTVIFEIQGYGGSVQELARVVNAIKYAEANGVKVVGNVVGAAYSAHAIFTCALDSVVIRPTGSLMFHPAARLDSFMDVPYNVHGIELNDEPVVVSTLAMCVQKKILTMEDIKEIAAGKGVNYQGSFNGTFRVVNNDIAAINTDKIINMVNNLAYKVFTYTFYLLAVFCAFYCAGQGWRKRK